MDITNITEKSNEKKEEIISEKNMLVVFELWKTVGCQFFFYFCFRLS